jgi:DNA-binding LacI/PurR family transcriptional regulator
LAPWKISSRDTTKAANPVKRKRGIHAVAELAGVSISTVSRVMNGATNVDPKISRRVWKAVAETKYVPNRHAQALISGRTRLIGLLVPDIMNPFFPELIHGFEQAAAAEGFGILIGSTHDHPTETEEWVQRMLQHGIEGLALLTFKEESAQVYSLLRNIPWVQIETGARAVGPETVAIDYEFGTRQAVQHLAALGHRDIVFAAGASQDFTAELRREAFRKSMREIGIAPEENIYDEEHTLEGGIAAARKILNRPALPTALICSNDLMAIGALKILHFAGFGVPGDISLIGLDDIHLAQFTSPPLTTIRLPRTKLAEVCFEALFQKLRPNERAARNDSVATDLIVRESTGFPPHAPQSKAGKLRKPGAASA